MLERIISGSLLIVSIIHLLPITGMISASKLTLLYGVNIADPNLEILMRHRAVLFGILGVFFAFAGLQPSLQPIAFAIGFASVMSFFYLSISVGGFNQAIRKIHIADVAALIALLIALTAYLYKQTR